MRTLADPNSAWADDRGEADPAVRAALAAAEEFADRDQYLAAVAALCGARLLLPVVAAGDESARGPDPNRHAELVAVLMTSASGRSGALAFTGLDALQRFDPRARPVPCTVDTVAAAALDAHADAIVIDVAGPSMLVIDGALTGSLAAGNRLVRLEDGWGWLSARSGQSGGPTA